jgi:hypothetical protein
VDVVVTNPDGQSATAANAFAYVQSPTETAISPATGPAVGGIHVTLTGTRFKAGASVRFGDTIATNVVVHNDTTISVTVPPHPAGAVTVTIIDPGTHAGTKFHRSNSASASPTPAITFTYTGAPPVVANPTISRVDPAQGSARGGDRVTVTGTGFVSGMKVTFGGVAATDLLIQNATTVLVTTPAHAAGSVDVTVTDANGAHPASLTGGYLYVAHGGGDGPPVGPPPTRGGGSHPTEGGPPPVAAPPHR